ncbi:MAG: lipid-A-disaccharide synthase-related protein [Synechococcaceae cyanobacterium]|nr:lipid-A-disaccharide synthase-related protein [Synechococcaceae cyanobacterium]
MTSVLLLSNGHGEDLSGSLLGRELQERGVIVEALPLVGHGEPYRRAGIPVLGTTREFSTGGIGYTSLAGRVTEALEGQALYLLARLRVLACSRRGTRRLVVVVGDVVPVLAAWLARLPSAVYLVAYSSHYEGRLRLPWPCGWLLRRPGVAAVWSRDALTAADLSRQLGRPVRFLGNPFLDPVAPPAAPLPAAAGPSLALLPGSRMPEARRNLERLLRVLALLPSGLRQPGTLTLRAALVRDLQATTVARLAEPLGWRTGPAEDGAGAGGRLLRGHGLAVELHWDRFAAVLAGADLVLSMTGTAAEQAVGLGKPVLQVVGDGPQFTAGFAEAQRRLLGPGVVCAPGTAGLAETLRETARMAAELLARASDRPAAAAWRRQLAQEGEQRLGAPGGTSRMADAIMRLLSRSS